MAFLNQCSDGFLPPIPNMGDPLSCLTDGERVYDTVDGGIKMPGPRAAPPGRNTERPMSNCRDLVPANTTGLYISGSSNFLPLLKELAPALIKQIGIVPIFRTTTSCSGAFAMNSSSPTYKTDHWINDPASATEAYAQIFLGPDSEGKNQAGKNCLLGTGPEGKGIPVDVGESEIFPETCGITVNGNPINNSPDEVSETLGPILPLVFVVPPSSPEQTISYKAARQVFGGGGGVMPWNNPQQIFVRANGTATLRLLAKELDLTPTQVWGIDQGSAMSMALNVGAVSDPVAVNQTIGILGTDLYDGFRGSLKPLAFQAKDQACAYVPDSKLTKYDKQNVRDGHYPLWGRIHFFTERKMGLPVSDAAQRFVFQVTTANLDPEILSAFITARLVPTCAMQVKRDTELGDLVVDDPPPHACSCVFDKIATGLTGAPDGCTACTRNDDCPKEKPACNYSFCEASQ